MSDTAIKEINSSEDFADLAEFTVVVGAPAELDGEQVVISLQNIQGKWYAPGFPAPLDPADLNTDTFFPAQVVYTL